MKKICFPCTSPIHLARNQLLLEKLKENFEVHIAEYSQKEMSMSEIACDITPKFKVALDKIKPDLVLIRADRAELLPCTALSVYSGYKVAQLEAGDLSGVVDNKVRFAISHLSDYHFTTNEDSQNRMLSMGFKNVWNCGSLDCEYALSVKPLKLRSKPYILCLWHPTPNEDSNALYEAIKAFENDFQIVGIRGNHDYGEKSQYQEFYKPDEFINLLRYASCVVGNSSCLIKECSALGVQSVLVGDRQKNRLRPHNVLDVACEKELIKFGIEYQLKHGHYLEDRTYLRPNTSQEIARIIGTLV